MPRPVSEPSPYIELDRAQWRELRQSTPLSLTEADLSDLRGLGEQIDLAEVGFDIPNEFVVGYGLDFAERYRDLPYVGTLHPRVYQ